MASAGARAYNGGLGAEPPAWVQGAEPLVRRQGGEAPPEADSFFREYTFGGVTKLAPFYVFGRKL